MEYAPSRIKEVLDILDIEPYKTNRVDGNQAAKILTWRLKAEMQADRTYTIEALRRRVKTKALRVAEQINPRLNLYDVRDIFELSLMPARAEGAKQRELKQKKES